MDMRKNPTFKKLALNLFACMKHKNLDHYLSNYLLEIIVSQTIDSIRNHDLDPGAYHRQTFYKYIADTFVAFLAQERIFQEHGLFRIPRMRTIESLTLYQDVIPVRTEKDKFDGVERLAERQSEIVSELFDSEIMRPLLDAVYQCSVSYSFIKKFHINSNNSECQNDAGVYQHTIGFTCDYCSHFYVEDPRHSCAKVYITSDNGSVCRPEIYRNFTWDERKKRWELDIFKPPYSPFFIAATRYHNKLKICLLKKETIKDIRKENIVFSSMHHIIDGKAMLNIASSNFYSMYDDDHYLWYSGDYMKLVPTVK